MNIQITCDSTCDLTKDLYQEFRIKPIPMGVMMDNKRDLSKKVWTIPNLLSIFRLCLIPVLIWLYRIREDYQLAVLVLNLSGITDLADGFIARKFNMVSDLGKILDPVADKLTQAAMLFCLTVRYRLMCIPLAVLVLKEIIMAATGLMVIHRTGRVCGAVWHGKTATTLLYVIMGIHVFWNNIPEFLSVILIILCSGMMLISFILYVIQNMRTLRCANID